jgi:hypothetical protein
MASIYADEHRALQQEIRDYLTELFTPDVFAQEHEFGDGFNKKVLPLATASGNMKHGSITGKLNAVMIATGPSGCQASRMWCSGRSDTMVTRGLGSAEQFRHTPPQFDGQYVIIGSWVVGTEPAGISLREDQGRITRNTSRFVPHFIRP